MLGINLFILILLILWSSIFSSSETAIFSLSIIKARRFLNEKRKGAEALIYLKENPHNTLITILILNNLVNIAASSLATIISINLFGSKGIGFAIGVTTILILIFGEVTPKSLALRYSPQIALLTSRPIKFLLFLLYPITFSFNFLTKPFLSIENKETLSEEEIKEIVTLGREEGVLNKQILRSGTSIGALIREAEFGQSKADFVSKISIALKEANETDYWLLLLKDTGYITEEQHKNISKDLREIIKLLISTVKTAKKNMPK